LRNGCRHINGATRINMTHYFHSSDSIAGWRQWETLNEHLDVRKMFCSG